MQPVLVKIEFTGGGAQPFALLRPVMVFKHEAAPSRSARSPGTAVCRYRASAESNRARMRPARQMALAGCSGPQVDPIPQALGASVAGRLHESLEHAAAIGLD